MSDAPSYDYREKGRRDFFEGIRNARLYEGIEAHHKAYREGWDEARKAKGTFIIIDDPKHETTKEQRDKVRAWATRLPNPFPPPAPELPRTTCEQYLAKTGQATTKIEIPLSYTQVLPKPPLESVALKTPEGGYVIVTPPEPDPKPAQDPKIKEGDRGQFAFF